MRLRHIPGSEDIVSASPYVLRQPEQYRGCFRKYFGNNHPLEIEIGMGKGRFIMELAQRHPHINFLGIERYPSVLLRAIKKQEELHLTNLFFLCVDAKALTEIFAPGEVSRIYLNFSDPWPKDRHAKRRLTSHQFFERYQQILASNGTVEFKTDNTALFDFSLEEVKEAGWKLDAFTRNLHQDNTMMEGNVMTEYEERFSKMGNPIYKLIASLPQK